MTSNSQPVASGPRPKLFLSYARRDAKELADRLRTDLLAHGYEVWQDSTHIPAATAWEEEIVDGLRSTQLVIALLSPSAIRRAADPGNPDEQDSVCLDEISFARFAQPPKPVVPVMAVQCEPPFCVFRLAYVDLCSWSESEQKYRSGLKQILEAVEEGLLGRVRYTWWESTLKPWDFTAFVFEKRRNFCGRQWLFDEIEAWCRSGNSPALLITGDPGVGKSAVVAQLLHVNPNDRVLAYHCCQSETKATLAPGLFVRSIAAMIAGKLESYSALLHEPAVAEALRDDNCGRDAGSAFERGVLAPLETLHAPESGVLYLLIDALDEALLVSSSSTTIVDVLASRIERFPSWLRVVATTRKEPAVLARLSGLRAVGLEAQDARNLEDVERYIDLRLRTPGLLRRMAANGKTREEVRSTLRDKSRGNFLYAQKILEGVERDLYALDDLSAIPPGLRGLYLRDFTSRFPDDATFDPVCRVLEVLAAARAPMSEALLRRATGLEQEVTLPRTLRTLSAYVPGSVGPDGEKQYSIFHRSLSEWLTETERRGEPYHVSKQRGDERLAQACWEEYRDGAAHMSPYVLENLPAHLRDAGRWANLLDAVKSGSTGFIPRWIEGGEGEAGLTCLVGLIRFLEREDGDPVVCAELATQVARIYSKWGEYDKATNWLAYALRNTSWFRGRRARVIALHELGSLALYRRDLPLAARNYNAALRLSGWIPPPFHDEAAANLIGLATVSHAKYEHSRTLRFARRAILKSEEAKDMTHLIAAERMLGAAHKALGAYSEAEQHLQAAMVFAEALGAYLERARVLLLMGWLHYDRATLQGESPTEATKSFQNALENAQQVRDLYCSVEALMSMAWCDLSANQAPVPLSRCSTLISALPAGKHPELRAELRLGLAVATQQQDKLDEAKGLYEDVISFCEKHHIYGCRYRAMIGLGATDHRQGRTKQAEMIWGEALRVAARISDGKRSLAQAGIELCRTEPAALPR